MLFRSTGLLDLDPEGLPESRAALWSQLPILSALPTAAELGQAEFDGADLCPCRPGEAAALAQLAAFCDGVAGSRGIPLFGYEPGRNMPGEAGTSGLSAALKFGTLSPRQAWATAQQAREVAAALGGEIGRAHV